MKLSDIEPGSERAYHEAAKIIIEQIEFELETCQRLLGTDPSGVITLLANTPNWDVFFEEDDSTSPYNS
jgi:hypothetical protein